MSLDHRKIILQPGTRFGKWTILKEAEGRCANGTVKWICKCDCGTIRAVPVATLRAGKSKSCGCGRIESVRLKYGEASFNKLYSSYRLGAAQRNLDFLLTKDEFRKLTSHNCFYCGKEPNKICKNNGKKSEFFGYYVYNGIDRINNSKGYQIDNCIPCCFECNQAKLTLSQEEFLGLIKRIYEHLQL